MREVSTDGAGREIRLYDDLMPLRSLRGDLDRMALYAGQSAGLVKDVQAAADIVVRIIEETEGAVAIWRTG